jgi:Legume lectin domain
MENGDAFTYYATAYPSFSLYGTPLYAWIDYYAGGHVLAVYVSTANSRPSAPMMTATYNIASNLGATAYVGFTGGTGSGNQDEDILNWQFNPHPAFAYPSSGDFVLGALTAASALATTPLPLVTYWSPIWSRSNILTSEPRTYGPVAFKGFAGSLSSNPPVCGGTWEVPAAYSAAPPSTVPAFMAVIVSSSITQSNGTISGNIKKIVIVETLPGFNNAHGRTATGFVVDTLCSS